MLRIRFKPAGRKRQITYRVVVTEKRSKLKGEPVEDLGWFDPGMDKVELNEERVKYWIEKGGAQPSDRVYNLLVEEGIVEGDKRAVHSKKKVSEEERAEDSGEEEKSDEEDKKVEEDKEEDKEPKKDEEKKPEKVEGEDEEEEPEEDNAEKEEKEDDEEGSDNEKEKKE